MAVRGQQKDSEVAVEGQWKDSGGQLPDLVAPLWGHSPAFLRDNRAAGRAEFERECDRAAFKDQQRRYKSAHDQGASPTLCVRLIAVCGSFLTCGEVLDAVERKELADRRSFDLTRPATFDEALRQGGCFAVY